MEIIELEEWREIAGSAGYQVSSYGRVRSPKRIVRVGADIDGRLRITYRTKDGRPRTTNLAPIVAAAFISERPQSHWVHYLDNNPSNCRADNLEYRPNLWRRPPGWMPHVARTPTNDHPDSTRPTIQPKRFTGHLEDFREYWSATPDIIDIKMQGTTAVLTDHQFNRFEIYPGELFAARGGRIFVIPQKETRPDDPDGLP